MKDSREGKPGISGRYTQRGLFWRCMLHGIVGWGWNPEQAYMNWWILAQRDAG
jgi:hypothetical protein